MNNNPQKTASKHLRTVFFISNILDRQSEDSDLVFPNERGGEYTALNFNYKPVKKIKKDAKLPDDFRIFHGQRHAFASELASSGKVEMYTLQKLLTHKSPQMTQRYAHLRDEALKDASEIAANIFTANGK